MSILFYNYAYDGVIYIRSFRDVNVFIFILKNDRFVMKTTTKERKRNDCFSKQSLTRTLCSIVNDAPLLTIINDDPALTFVNDRNSNYTSCGASNLEYLIFPFICFNLIVYIFSYSNLQYLSIYLSIPFFYGRMSREVLLESMFLETRFKLQKRL